MKQTTRIICLLLALLTAFSLTAAAADVLTITSATYNGADLAGATVPAGSDIVLVFSNNVTDDSVLANNISKIKVKDTDGNVVSATVSASDKNTFVVTLGSDLAKGEYTLTIGKEMTAKNGSKLDDKKEYKFNVKGSGTGEGGGTNPLTVESVTVGEVSVEGAELSGGDVIVILFSRGMTENAEADAKLIRVLKADGSEADYTVILPEKKDDDDNAKRTFKVQLGELEGGSYNLVLSKDIKANNGNTLGEDMTIAFTVKETAPQSFFARILTFFRTLPAQFRALYTRIVNWFRKILKKYLGNVLTDVFPPLAPPIRL